jgi:hypothetical protein
MEQKQLTNLTLTAGVIAVIGMLLGNFIWVPYLRIIFCAVVVILTLYNMTQWKNLRKIDLLLNFLWFLWAGWSIYYLITYRV